MATGIGSLGFMRGIVARGVGTAAPARVGNLHYQIRYAATSRSRGRPMRQPKLQVKLLEPVEGLGEVGDIISVSRGYARNFLMPKQLVEVIGRAGAKQDEKGTKGRSPETIVAMLGKSTLTIEAGEEAVTAHVIAERCLTDLYLEVPPQRIGLSEPLSSAGSYVVPVSVDDDHSTELKINVVQ